MLGGAASPYFLFFKAIIRIYAQRITKKSVGKQQPEKNCNYWKTKKNADKNERGRTKN